METKEENQEETPQEKKPQENIHLTKQTAQELDNVFDEKERESQEKVEAALFISGKFLSLQDLIVLTDINPLMLKEILHRLEKKYTYGAIILINKNSNWKMDVSEKYHYLINRLATGTAEFTKAEQETLAIIAYKQPVKQSIIVRIRGNKSYNHIKKFKEIGLLKAKRAGHTYQLSLSEEFYDYFHVQDKKSVLESAEDKKETNEQETNKEEVKEPEVKEETQEKEKQEES